MHEWGAVLLKYEMHSPGVTTRMGRKLFMFTLTTVNLAMSAKWENCTLNEIKAELRKRNAKVSGRKADLI